MVDYSIQAKKTKLSGHDHLGEDIVEYHSRLEARVAQLCLRNEIYFKPHKTYEVIDRDGDEFNYSPDFVFKRPHKLAGVSKPVSALEVKGVLKPHDFVRSDAWEYTTDRNMWIALPAHVRYWYEHEFSRGVLE